MKSRYKVIYFDLDGTLVDYESDAAHAFERACDHAIEAYPQLAGILTNQIFRRARDATYIQYGDTGIPLRDWYRECMRAVLEPVEVFDLNLADQMGQIYGKFRNTTLEVFDDALEVLPKLSKVYELGLISNGSSRIQQSEIAEFFTYSVYAREVGHEKPAPEIFRAAAEKAGCESHEMLLVGDGQHTDIIGARNAGIEMVWINRTGAILLMGISPPEHEITDLRDMLKILDI